MDKQKLATYAMISVGVVLIARFGGTLFFNLLDTYLFRKKDRRDPSLDELIDNEYLKLSGGRGKPSGQAVMPRLKKGQKPQELPQPDDPAVDAKKAILHRIYDVELKRGSGESEEAFALRVLGLKERESQETLKRAFKIRSKELHPDRFNLDAFDGKTRQRLGKRVHENYLQVQAAYQYLKKNP